MAKVTNVRVAGVEMTLKEKAVYDAVKTAGRAVRYDEIATEVADFCATDASVRSTLARLDRTKGVLRSEFTLRDDKAVRAYALNDTAVTDEVATDEAEAEVLDGVPTDEVDDIEEDGEDIADEDDVEDDVE